MATLAAMIVLLGVGTLVGAVLTAKTGDLTWLFLTLPFSLLLLVFSRYAPTGYRLARDGVHVERKAGPTIVPYASIHAADRERRPVAGLSLAGSNGLFGRFGRFWNPRLGFYRLYVTNTQTVVWLITRDGMVGLSPDRPEEFVARLERRLEARRNG